MIHQPSDPRLSPKLNGEQVARLSGYGKERDLDTGEYLFKERDYVNAFYVVLEGEIRILRVGSDGAEVTVNIHKPGGFVGQLAALAGRSTGARARAVVPSQVLEITAVAFRDVAAADPEVADIFISTLARRMRFTQAWMRQQDKMVALGKLSAGLAHELNNPAAAARRAADTMREESLKAQRVALAHDERFTSAQKEHLATLERELTENSAIPLYIDALERSDREDELITWLEDHGLEDGWELAPTLVSAGLDTKRLEALTEGPDGLHYETLAGTLEWLGTTLNLAAIAREVEQSTKRISELVRAMKEYSHMDKSAMREVDVREGLENTLTILGHKLKGVSVEREYEEDLPTTWANAGELNQVWTNIIDNAVDAMEGHGKLKVKTSWEENYVLVEIIDDGPGIPREVKDRIFEPFFTTKDVGEGTGLGLDIVRRVVVGHGGEIRVDSKPGETTFKVRLPINGSRSDLAGKSDRG
jgi:signal transduction histidine kinase